MSRSPLPSLLWLATLAAPLAPIAVPPALAQRADGDSAPYVPTPPPVVEGMLDLAGLKAGEHLIDLGSGDGRIAIAAAKRGATALGIDINSRLVARARMLAEFDQVQDRARFVRDDLFTVSIRDADVVTLYLIPSVNLRLRPKLLTELRPGTRVVSHGFDMGDWPPQVARVIDGKNVFLWIIPAIAGGGWTMTLADGRELPLEIEQRYSRVTGSLGGRPIADPMLDGDRLSFTHGGQSYHAIVGDAAITPDPQAPADSATGWRAVRAM